MELVETVDLSGVEVQATAFIFLEFIEVIKSIGKMKMVIVQSISMWRMCECTMRRMLIN